MHIKDLIQKAEKDLKEYANVLGKGNKDTDPKSVEAIKNLMCIVGIGKLLEMAEHPEKLAKALKSSMGQKDGVMSTISKMFSGGSGGGYTPPNSPFMNWDEDMSYDAENRRYGRKSGRGAHKPGPRTRSEYDNYDDYDDYDTFDNYDHHDGNYDDAENRRRYRRRRYEHEGHDVHNTHDMNTRIGNGTTQHHEEEKDGKIGFNK